MTPEETAVLMARIDAGVAEILDRRRDQDTPGHTHCHFTYEHGRYRSPWYWPTRADAELASRSLPDPRVTDEPRVFAVHGTHCACTPEREG